MSGFGHRPSPTEKVLEESRRILACVPYMYPGGFPLPCISAYYYISSFEHRGGVYRCVSTVWYISVRIITPMLQHHTVASELFSLIHVYRYRRCAFRDTLPLRKFCLYSIPVDTNAQKLSALHAPNPQAPWSGHAHRRSRHCSVVACASIS